MTMKETPQHTTSKTSDKQPPRSLSTLLDDLEQSLHSETVKVSDLIEAFQERGFGLLLFIFALPAAIPLPALGINVIIALPLLLLTGQQAYGAKKVWLPKTVLKRSISRSTMVKFIDGARPWIKRLEFFIRPRFGFLTDGLFPHLIGFFGLIMALSVCVPIPLTNTVPSFGIALMAIGVIMRDGLAVLAGAVIGTLWVLALTFILLFLGTEGLEVIKNAIH